MPSGKLFWEDPEHVPETLAERLGAAIQLRRLTLRITQQQLADKSRVSYTHLGQIERGSVNPSFKTYERIIKALDDDLPAFFLLAGRLGDPMAFRRNKRLPPIVAKLEDMSQVLESMIGLLDGVLNDARKRLDEWHDSRPREN